MKLVVRHVKSESFTVDVQPDETIFAVKRQIEATQGFPCQQLVLIHRGRVLANDTTLKDSGVSEQGFLVMFISSKGQSAAPAVVVPAPVTRSATTLAAQVPAAASSAPSTTIYAPAAAAASVTPVAAYEQQAASDLVVGDRIETAIQGLIDMGAGCWDRDTVQRALRAAFNNPDRAFEYLSSGIPEQAHQAQQAREVQDEYQAQEAAPAGSLDFLLNYPQFQQLRSLVQANPQLLERMLQELGTQNPELMHLLEQGREEFIRLLGETAGPLEFLRNNPQFQEMRSRVLANPQELEPLMQELARQNPQLMQLIRDNLPEFGRLMAPEGGILTDEEYSAIQRLQELGFSEQQAVEAFIFCNKNEQLATNYLLERRL